MNETLRLIFAALLGFSLLILFKNWEAWQGDQVETNRTGTTTSQTISDSDTPTSTNNANNANRVNNANGTNSTDNNDVPVVTQSLQGSGDVPASSVLGEGDIAVASGKHISVETDWLIAKISEKGGNLVEVRLKKHLRDGEPLALLENEERQYIAQSGLIGAEGVPNHSHYYRALGADEDNRHLASGQEEVTVQLRTQQGDIELTKTYVFKRADYLISVALDAKNLRSEPVQLQGYFQLAHDGRPPRDYSSILPTFFGAALYTDDSKFVKISFDDIGEDSYPRKSDNGWVGIIQRYFAAVWLPPIDSGEREFFMRKSGSGARLGIILPLGIIAPGASETVASRLFAGAQEQDNLQPLHDSGDAPGISLIVDYGWLTFIAVLLFDLLALIYTFVNNWGVAIILLTFSIKLIFYPLSSAAYRSMAKMKEEAPRIKQMQEKFGSDKQRLQKEMMALYREKKINPLGGCLPILVQIPVFIALYWVLLGSVELRQAPFFGWISDLSVPDPYYILPVIMGISMFMQTKLSPAPPDPTQAMIMKIMPIGFSIFSIFFPAGLVLYWVVNTTLSIAQQWYITHSIAAKAAKKT